MKVYELQGAALDWAVAQCEGDTGNTSEWLSVYTDGTGDEHYSTDWSQGGPIIEREKIEWRWMHGRKSYGAEKPGEYRTFSMDGPSILIAAMRCYVASKLGYMIELPEELK